MDTINKNISHKFLQLLIFFHLFLPQIFNSKLTQDSFLYEPGSEESSEMNLKDKLLSVEFEVFGHVQGVFFRKHTQQESRKLGLKGWCMNTERGTVQGVMEGQQEKIEEM